MTLPARFPVCPLCHGVHKHLADGVCIGVPQNDWQWMVDRGVLPWRASEIVHARSREGLGSLVLPPDPLTPPGPPYGAPAPVPRVAPAPEPVQEVLF